MSQFVFSRRIVDSSDFEVGCGVLFGAEEAARFGSWSRWSVESAREWVLSDGFVVLGNERLVWAVVDCLREGPRDAGVLEALAVLYDSGVVDLVGPALDQVHELGLL